VVTVSSRCWSSGGGGAFDQACHQRVSVIAGVSQLRTARSAWGQLGAGGLWDAPGGWGWPTVAPLLHGGAVPAWVAECC
jgi:hypothetical protein